MALFALLILLAVSACSASVHLPGLRSQFEEFKRANDRAYPTQAEEEHRFRVFAFNMELAAQRNAASGSRVYGVTKFSDLTAAEFEHFTPATEQLRTLKASLPTAPSADNEAFLQSLKARALPAVVDWRTKGGVTPVSNMQQCGAACVGYAFTGNMEGVNFQVNNVLTPLSADEIVSCASDDGCGCGAWPVDAYNYILNDQGGKIATSASWPFNSSNDGTCVIPKDVQYGAVMTSYVNITADEDKIAWYVAYNGPVFVSVDATSWQMYTSGVMTDCTYTSLDFSATIVGYNDDTNPAYWIIKNEWGTDWGMDGYIYVQKGTNQCGIKDMALTGFAKKQ